MTSGLHAVCTFLISSKSEGSYYALARESVTDSLALTTIQFLVGQKTMQLEGAKLGWVFRITGNWTTASSSDPPEIVW